MLVTALTYPGSEEPRLMSVYQAGAGELGERNIVADRGII